MTQCCRCTISIWSCCWWWWWCRRNRKRIVCLIQSNRGRTLLSDILYKILEEEEEINHNHRKIRFVCPITSSKHLLNSWSSHIWFSRSSSHNDLHKRSSLLDLIFMKSMCNSLITVNDFSDISKDKANCFDLPLKVHRHLLDECDRNVENDLIHLE